MRAVFALVAWIMLAAPPLAAQARPAWEGGTIMSLGQPRAWKWTVAASAGRTLGGDDQTLAAAALGLQRDLLNPLLSLAAVHVELGAGVRGEELDPRVRIRLISPVARAGAGLDHAFLDGRTDLVLSLFHPGRRGGLFGDGSVARLDYLPGRGNAVTLGIETPVLRRIPMGRTRPAHDHVRLPAGPVPAFTPVAAELQAPFAELRSAAGWIRRTVLPFPDADLATVRSAGGLAGLRAFLDGGVDGANGGARSSAHAEVHRFHDALERAIAMAIGGAVPADAASLAVATRARSILLDQVLFPYNRLLGQAKRDDSVRGLGAAARGAFLRWLYVEAGVPRERIPVVLRVFDELIDVIEENRAAASAEWRDTRFVWLPLQYALRPEQHQTQAQLDALVEQALGVRFTEGNFVSYVVNEQFQYHLSRTIREAEDYHVLWTHDFRGRDGHGDPDEMSYRHVLRSYLAAMTQRVRDYDWTGRFPVYLLVIDQWFYEVNRARLWLDLLEDPAHHRLRLPRSHAAWQDSIAAAQAELREAIAASALLQEQARQHGAAWLRNLVRVHVNVTNPADPSFWSKSVVRGMPLPDNMMRDHRKLVFYDITEEDPYRGGAMYTGAGVGEHYANLSWEDRSLLVRGPAVLGLKHALRQMLLGQGLAPEHIPHPLQPRPRGPDYDDRIRAAMQQAEHPLRALEMHNLTGFGQKDANVAKAVLYTLMPPGSVINIPDSLWNSDFWGSALLGCVLRGARVLLIAPAADNAPADVFGTLERSRDLLQRLLDARELLARPIEAAGGMLRIGLYAPELQVTDIPAKVRGVKAAFERHAWLHELFGFPPSVYEGLAELADVLENLSMAPEAQPEFEYDPRPKLHLKANLFASGEAWTLMTRPEWAAASWEYAMHRIAQVQLRTAAIASFATFPDAFADAGSGMVHDWFAELDAPTRERVVFYTMMGSHNQNSRSLVIDAEVGFLVSGWPAIIPYIDFFTIAGQTIWLDGAAGLDGLLPRGSTLKRRVVRWIRLAL
jgi:hypothetical protein